MNEPKLLSHLCLVQRIHIFIYREPLKYPSQVLWICCETIAFVYLVQVGKRNSNSFTSSTPNLHQVEQESLSNLVHQMDWLIVWCMQALPVVQSQWIDWFALTKLGSCTTYRVSGSPLGFWHPTFFWHVLIYQAHIWCVQSTDENVFLHV